MSDTDLDSALAALLKNYIGSRMSGFLFETKGSAPSIDVYIYISDIYPCTFSDVPASSGWFGSGSCTTNAPRPRTGFHFRPVFVFARRNYLIRSGRNEHGTQRQCGRERPGYDITAAMSAAATGGVILFCSLIQERSDEGAQPRRNSESTQGGS